MSALATAPIVSRSLVNSGRALETRLVTCLACGNTEWKEAPTQSDREELAARPLSDCIDTITDKLFETIDHNGTQLLVRVAEIEMPVCDEFAAAPLVVRVRKDGVDFEFTLKSVTTRSHWRTRDRKFWCLSYTIEMG